jgi:hypothetical protein
MFICKKSMKKPENTQMLRTWAIATRFENYTHGDRIEEARLISVYPFTVAWISDTHGEAKYLAIYCRLPPGCTLLEKSHNFWLCGTEVILKGIVIS